MSTLHRLSAEELASRFPREWLLLIDFEARDVTELRAGAVAAHHQNRRVLERAAGRQAPGTYALWFTGDERPLEFVRVA